MRPTTTSSAAILRVCRHQAVQHQHQRRDGLRQPIVACFNAPHRYEDELHELPSQAGKQTAATEALPIVVHAESGRQMDRCKNSDVLRRRGVLHSVQPVLSHDQLSSVAIVDHMRAPPRAVRQATIRVSKTGEACVRLYSVLSLTRLGLMGGIFKLPCGRRLKAIKACLDSLWTDS